jgi:diaminohydroxyphosphoribosylaminopyrimidine deaminase / 5-amino-6-(5-phosphoribosylamino)uracil reductase
VSDARRMLDLAGRAALRGFGRVEPNPMVGAVVVKDGRVIGVGHHRVFGGPHAEVDALGDCRRRGEDPRGGVMYVTLEPCDHFGKQPPCSRAVIAAGVSKVVIARRDPNPVSTGGIDRLRSAGIAVEVCSESRLAVGVSDGFVRRITQGLPWTIAKWAQTLDGKVATRTGDSKWISGEASRRRVHRLRGRVDAIVTGVGTVVADDPLLTVRGVASVRPRVWRVVIDPRVETPAESKLVATARADGAPVLVLTTAAGLGGAGLARAERLRASGVEVVAASAAGDGTRVDLAGAWRGLLADRGVATVLVESGPRLLASLFEADLVDQAMVFIAPKVLGDGGGRSAVEGRPVELMNAARRLRVDRVSRSGEDAVLWLGR